MMSSTTEMDPFIQFQTEVHHLMTQTRQQFSSYLRIRSISSKSTNPSPELLSAKADLEATLHELQSDLTDMHESVKAVEADPYAYGLDVEEVSRRRRFVRELEGEVEDMMEELKKTVEKSAKQASGLGGDAYVDMEEGGEDEQFSRQWEQQQQIEMMREQDLALEDVSRTIGNIRQQAHVMGRELEEQAEMLDEVERDTDRVQDKLSQGMKKVAWVIKQNEDRWSSFCIALLIMVLIILLVLLLLV